MRTDAIVNPSDSERLKYLAAHKVLDFVSEGMKIGIGTGSTAEIFIKLLAAKIAEGFSVQGVATSERSALLCRKLNVPVYTLDELPQLDVAIDGADEIGPRLALVKGGGGALLREKIVAASAQTMIVIADESKLVPTLGAFGLPIEVNPFGYQSTMEAIKKVSMELNLKSNVQLRQTKGKPFITDGGHYIADGYFGLIPDPYALCSLLYRIPGVVEHGLFLNMAKKAVIACNDGHVQVRNADE